MEFWGGSTFLAPTEAVAVAGLLDETGWDGIICSDHLVYPRELSSPYPDSPTGKPMWAPDPGLFVPIWAAGYALMAVAGWLVWRRPESSERSVALKLYAGQFALSALWAPAFFGLGVAGATGPWLALGVLVVLDIVMLAAIFRVGDVHRGAAALLVPAFAWALYMTTLNSAVAVLAM